MFRTRVALCVPGGTALLFASKQCSGSNPLFFSPSGLTTELPCHQDFEAKPLLFAQLFEVVSVLHALHSLNWLPIDRV